jgi:nitrate/nitrite-specific signal transduction histidine kinase
MEITQAAARQAVAWGTGLMQANGKARRDLFDELLKLRQRVVELEAVEANCRRELAALRQSHVRLQVLYDISRAGLELQSAEDIARIVLDSIRRLAPCQRVRISLFDFETRQARVWTKDAEGKAWSGMELMTESVPADERDSRGLGSKMLRTLNTQSIRPCLSVPLVTHDTTMGVLNVWSSPPTGLAPEQVETIQEVAGGLAAALDQASQREQSARYAPPVEHWIHS